MKKIIVIVVFVSLVGSSLTFGTTSLKVGMNLGFNFFPSEMREFYGNGSPLFGGSLAFQINQFEIRAEMNYLKKKGEMSLTKEEITFSRMSFLQGLRIHYKALYLGGGVIFASYKEKLPHRLYMLLNFSVDENAPGFYVEIGANFNIGRFQIDLNPRYTQIETLNSSEKINIGGFQVSIGIAYLLF